MFQNLRVYKCGDYYKYISIPVKNDIMMQDFQADSVKAKKEVFNGDYVRKLNNLVRCKSSISDLLLCNDFKFFITITFNSNYNRFDLDSLRKSVNLKIRKLRQKFKDLKFQYLFVPEKHKNGAWHIHGFLSNDFIYFLNLSKNKKYLECEIFDVFGFNNVEILYSNRVISYVTKYISKDFESREKGKHLYFATQGLNRPKLIKNIFYSNYAFNLRFFDFKNDYCFLKIDNYLHNVEMLQKY